MPSRGTKPNQNGSKSTRWHLPPLGAEGALSSPFLICRSGSFPSAFRSAGVLPAQGLQCVCPSISGAGSARPAPPGPSRGSFSMTTGSSGCNLPKPLDQGESLRTASGRGGPRRGWEAASPLRGPRSGTHLPSPGAPSISRWVLAQAGRAARGQGGGAPGPTSARCPRVSSAPHFPSAGAPSWVPVPAHSPSSPARPGAEGPAEQYRPQAHAVAMATRPVGGGGRTRSPWRRPAVRRPAGAKPRGGRVGTVLRLRARWSVRKVPASPAAPALLGWAVGDTDGGGAFPTKGTRALRPRASCCGREGAAGSRRSPALVGWLSWWSPRRPVRGRPPCSLPPRQQQADLLPPGVTGWRSRLQSGRHSAPRRAREPPPRALPAWNWLRTPRPVTGREMKPIRVCLGAGPPLLAPR